MDIVNQVRKIVLCGCFYLGFCSIRGCLPPWRLVCLCLVVGPLAVMEAARERLGIRAGICLSDAPNTVGLKKKNGPKSDRNCRIVVVNQTRGCCKSGKSRCSPETRTRCFYFSLIEQQHGGLRSLASISESG